MNILYTNFHRKEGGGHTTYILTLIRNSRHNTFVACPPTSKLYSILREQGYANLIPIDFPGKLKHYREIIANTRLLRRAIIEHDIDIVHTNGSSDNRMALYASLFIKKKFKVVFTKHNTIKFNNAISRLRMRKFNDAVIFVENFLGLLGLDKTYPRYHVIPNCIDTEHWKNRQPITTGHHLNLISTAGAARHKGWHHLIEAIAGLTEQEKSRLTVTMLARHERDMQKELAEAGDVCNFRFPGLMCDVRPELEKADIGFVLSYSESCSFACREMLSMGLPVIVSDFMILVNSIDSNCGWVTKTGDAASIRKTLRSILAMSPDRIDAMKAGARRKAEAAFALGAMIEHTDKVYAEIMAR